MSTVHGIWFSPIRLRVAAAGVTGLLVASCGGAPEAEGTTGLTAPETVVVTLAGASWFDPEVLTRVDPETIITGDEVFVYYYAWDATTSQVHRCAVSTSTLEG
jgi:hypothetical protein